MTKDILRGIAILQQRALRRQLASVNVTGKDALCVATVAMAVLCFVVFVVII
jgi:hypothetical protein